MDDDNVAKAAEVATFAAVAGRTGADLITCLMDTFQGPVAPWFYDDPERRCLFAGSVPGLSLLRNTFGDANALVRRAAFLELGGFTEDYGICHEDWELFARMTLRGYRMEVIPEALFWYRVQPQSMIRTTPRRANHVRSLRPYFETIPPLYHPLIEMAVGQSLKDLFPEPAPPSEPPLRHRLVDGLNARLKRLAPAHRAIKRLVRFATGAARAIADIPRRVGPTMRSPAPGDPAGPRIDPIRHEGPAPHRPIGEPTVPIAREETR
jgi:hypothetical protein